MRITDAVRIYEGSRTDLSISGTAAQTAVLPAGVYDLWSDVDCWLKIAPAANDVTVAAGANAGYKLMANNAVPFDVRAGTGVQQVDIHGLDAAGLVVSEVVDMGGTISAGWDGFTE